MRYLVLFNSLSCNGQGEVQSKALSEIIKDGDLNFVDVITVNDFDVLFKDLSSEDKIVICGGDGTLNNFINSYDTSKLNNDLLYFATGTGNDFLKDIEKNKGEFPVKINDYIKDLPLVTVNGKTRKFLNNVGFGIDGYCTEIGDQMRLQGKKDINYAGIAIKGILGKFHPVNATVTVDGVTKNYRKAWLAPTMYGRFYGGGMMAAPKQDRNNPDKTASVMIYYGSSKLKSLIVFPSIFKGEHVKHTEMVEVITGHNIKVEFDRPTPLQIDGETVLGVTSYEVVSKKN